MPDSLLLTQKVFKLKLSQHVHASMKKSLCYDKTNIFVSPALIQRKDMSWKIITSFSMRQSINCATVVRENKLI